MKISFTPKRSTPTGLGPQGWEPLDNNRVPSATYRKHRRLRNRMARTSRKANRS